VENSFFEEKISILTKKFGKKLGGKDEKISEKLHWDSPPPSPPPKLGVGYPFL
jgi:hypothetical protein